ncbi:MAG: hypothetical protein ACXAEU_11855 [Candidatus Hodarchaeales archaeon]
MNIAPAFSASAGYERTTGPNYEVLAEIPEHFLMESGSGVTEFPEK